MQQIHRRRTCSESNHLNMYLWTCPSICSWIMFKWIWRFLKRICRRHWSHCWCNRDLLAPRANTCHINANPNRIRTRLQNSWILQHNTVGPSQWTQQTATPLSSCSILVMASLKLSEMTSFLSQYLAVLFHLCSAARQFRVRRLPTTSALPVSAFFSKFFLTSLSRVL